MNFTCASNQQNNAIICKFCQNPLKTLLAPKIYSFQIRCQKFSCLTAWLGSSPWGKCAKKVSCPSGGKCTCPGRADGFFFRAMYCYKRRRRSKGRWTPTTYSSSYPSSSGSPVLGSQSFTTNFSVFVNVQVTEQRNKEAKGKTISAATLERDACPRTHARTQADQAWNINSPKLFPYVFIIWFLWIWRYIEAISFWEHFLYSHYLSVC